MLSFSSGQRGVLSSSHRLPSCAVPGDASATVEVVSLPDSLSTSGMLRSSASMAGCDQPTVQVLAGHGSSSTCAFFYPLKALVQGRSHNLFANTM